MQSGNFSRSVVVREWPTRHCFLSLPRSWASLTIPAPTPTFRLEVCDDRSILLSWAGDIHNSSPGEENTVLVNREILRNVGISNGEFGLITQVQVPPPCTSVTVHVGSLGDWQDLALNAEVAQSAFLSQVRVLSVGQNLPLWLEGGVRITLTVNQIYPPHNCGILQPMTKVEVLPPSEHEESEEICPISFTPSDTQIFESEDSDNPSDSTIKTSEPPKAVSDPSDIHSQRHLDWNSLTLLINYMTFKLQQQRIITKSPLRKDFCCGYRVLPIPFEEDNSQFHDYIFNHPALVIISKQSLSSSELQNEISFIANIKKLESPKEKAEKVSKRDDEKVGEVKQSETSVANSEMKRSSDKLCTVIVWENYIRDRTENQYSEKIGMLARGTSCVVSNCLRRMMKLDSVCIIELSNRDINVKTMPVTLDVSCLQPIDNEKNGMICDTLKRYLINFTSDMFFIINTSTLINIKVQNEDMDMLVMVRDGVPLKLTRESVMLLSVSYVSNPSYMPSVSRSVADLNNEYIPRHPYVGNKKVKSELQEHILLCCGHLLHQYKGIPQYALLHGSKGSGKTSLVETVAQTLSGYPYYLHCQIIPFKQFKGKKMETVEKKLQLVFREAIFRRPAVIFLEDLDSLVPSKGMENQDSGPLYDHTMQMVSMLKGLLDELLRFSTADDSHVPHAYFNKGDVMVVATSMLRTSIHPLLISPQGCHYFPCCFEIPPLDSEGRARAFSAMIDVYLHQYVQSHKSCSDETIGNTSGVDCITKCNNIETSIASRFTENCVLPDLSHLALRTVLHAKHRFGKNGKQLLCIHCGNNVAIKRKSTATADLMEKEDIVDEELETNQSIINADLQTAREGYIPLALQGLELTKKNASSMKQVGGLNDAQKTLKETLTWPSMYPNLFSKVKLRLRSGVLLYGPPGCGKTLIANSMAENCQLNFISVKGPELLSKYIGASEQAVRDAFERAGSAKPCILFFDEFESIAPRRGHDSTGVTDRVVNQLLTQMDGVEGLTGVYILAATSRPDLIDPALLRPGRLDKCVFCPMPSFADREDILRILSKGVILGEEIDWTEVAGATENFSGADLQSLLSTAQILVAQEALGDMLYNGVLEPDCKPSKNLIEASPVDASNVENKSMVQVTIEKESVSFVQNKCSSNDKDLTSIVQKYEVVSDSKGSNSVPFESNQILLSGDILKSEEKDTTDACIKVFKRHIDAALKEVKPSVTNSERRKYEQLYSSFVKSRSDHFGKQSPGKRATLA